MDDPGEDNLIRGLKEGHEESLRQCWKQHYEAVHRHVLTAQVRNGSEVDADEIVQEGFFRAFRDIGGFQGKCRLRTWLIRLAQNAAIDHYRRKDYKYPQPLSLNDTPAVHEVVAPLNAADQNPLRTLLVAETRDRIRRVLARLSENHRAVATMRLVDGLSVKETAEIMGRSEAAIKMLQLRAVQRITAILTQDPYFEDFKNEGVADDAEE